MRSKTALPFILFGVFLIGVDGVALMIGSVPLRYSRGVRLDEQPEMFWLAAGLYLLGGLIMIAIGVWRLFRR